MKGSDAVTRWKAFWCSLFITLFCLLPLYLLTVGGQLFGAQPVEETAEGVPVQSASPQDKLTLLLVLRDPAPAAVLLRLDAWGQRAQALVLPADTLLPAQEGRITLQECYAQAGPLQLRTALEAALGAPFERYLCVSADALAETFGEYAPVMNWHELGSIRDLALLRRLAFNGGEGAIAGNTAAALVRQCESPSAAAQLRAALYRAFLAESLPTLYGPAVELLRSEQELLTDITAVDIYGVERLLKLLAAAPPAVECAVPEGIVTADGWQLTDAGWQAMRALLAD